jgi:hypothetical protein
MAGRSGRPGADTYRGVEQVRKVILDRMDTLDFSQQTEDLIDVDDKVVVSEISMAMLWTLREQAITRIEFFFDRDQALEAAGVRE